MIFSSQLYQTFDTILVLTHGHSLYSGPGAFAPVDYFARAGPNIAPAYPQGYNVADYLLEVASDPPLALLSSQRTSDKCSGSELRSIGSGTMVQEKSEDTAQLGNLGTQRSSSRRNRFSAAVFSSRNYATTFLTQLECLCGREWKILTRSDNFRDFVFIG